MPSPYKTREIAQYESRHTTTKAITSNTTLTIADTGKLVVVDITGGDVTVTLPAAMVGLTYRFLTWKTDAGNDDLIIATAAAASLFKGGVIHADTNADNVSVEADFSNDDTFTAIDAEGGTDVTVVCDGTHWYITGVVVSDTVPTFA